MSTWFRGRGGWGRGECTIALYAINRIAKLIVESANCSSPLGIVRCSDSPIRRYPMRCPSWLSCHSWGRLPLKQSSGDLQCTHMRGNWIKTPMQELQRRYRSFRLWNLSCVLNLIRFKRRRLPLATCHLPLAAAICHLTLAGDWNWKWN